MGCRWTVGFLVTPIVLSHSFGAALLVLVLVLNGVGFDGSGLFLCSLGSWSRGGYGVEWSVLALTHGVGVGMKTGGVLWR
ncbi:unnamed protein product [Amaranthus hypochondriacus]